MTLTDVSNHMLAAFAEEDAYDAFCAGIEDPQEHPTFDEWIVVERKRLAKAEADLASAPPETTDPDICF